MSSSDDRPKALTNEDVEEKVLEAKSFAQNNALQLITAVACVGIFWKTRKLTKAVVKAGKKNDAYVQACQNTISWAIERKTPFHFFPGVGVYVHGLEEFK